MGCPHPWGRPGAGAQGSALSGQPLAACQGSLVPLLSLLPTAFCPLLGGCLTCIQVAQAGFQALLSGKLLHAVVTVAALQPVCKQFCLPGLSPVPYTG